VLIDVLAVHVVEVTIMQVVHMSSMLHGRVTAAWPVSMRMILMFGVLAGHALLQCNAGPLYLRLIVSGARWH
jgi:hypothetical protein